MVEGMKTTDAAPPLALHRSRLARVALLPLFVALCGFESPADERPAAFNAALDAYVEYHRFAGVALVVQDGEILFERAVGLANREWAIPTSLDTKYQIGSVTKPMTATLAMRFVERGLLSLDDPVTRHLPEYPHESGDRITIHHLLSHTSGIPGYGHFDNPRETVFRRKYTAEEYLHLFDHLPLQFEPGEGFEYSGFGYYLLGVILERVGRAPLDRLLEREIFQPAGMTNTLLDVGMPIEKRALPYQYDPQRLGYRRGDDRDVSTSFATGGVFSTVHDLWAFRRALDAGQLVSPETLELMSTPTLANYGYGWVVDQMPVDAGRRSVPMLLHNGAITGYTATLMWFPESRICIVVMCNTRGYKDTGLPRILASIAHGGTPSIHAQMGKRLAELAAQGSVASAIEEYQRVLATSGGPVAFGSSDPKTLIEAAERLVAAGHPAEAIALLEWNSDHFPNSARSRELLEELAEEFPAPLRVLFVGNSYTYFNDLPGLFRDVAKAGGVAVRVGSVATAAAKLADHLAKGRVARALEQESWDWVVLQEQSTLGTNRFHQGRAVIHDLQAFEKSAAALIDLVHESGAQPAMLLTWARRQAPANQAVLNEAIVRVASEAGAVVVPAGPAWREALEAWAPLPLYQSDGAHPAPAGTYLVAYTLLRTLLGPASDEPRTDFSAFVPPARVVLEAKAAAEIRAAVDRTVETAGTLGHGLPHSTHEPVVLATPKASSAAAESYTGHWSGPIKFLDEETASILELKVAVATSDELQVELLFDHSLLRPASGPLLTLFPDQRQDITVGNADGRIAFEHAAAGFGTTYRYQLALHDGQLTGWVALDAGKSTVFSAEVLLERKKE